MCDTSDSASTLKEATLLLSGWFLGIASSIIVTWVQRRQKRRELSKSMVTEFRHLRFRMAMGAFECAARSGQLTRNFVEALRSALLDPHGQEFKQESVKALNELLDGKDELLSLYASSIDLSKSFHLQEESLYFVDSQIDQIGILHPEIQERISRLKRQIDFYNNHVRFLEKMYDLTYQSNAENHRIAKENISNRIRAIATLQSEVVGTTNRLLILLND